MRLCHNCYLIVKFQKITEHSAFISLPPCTLPITHVQFCQKTAEKIIHCNQRNSMFLEAISSTQSDDPFGPVLIINLQKADAVFLF